MNRWEALVAIVKAFLERGSPHYAFAAVLVLGLPLVIGASVLLLKLVG